MQKTIRRTNQEKLWESQGPFVGVDEVGVAAIAGPLVACALVLPPGIKIKGVRDSKLIPTHEERVEVYERIMAVKVDYALGVVEPEKVSEVGTVQASVLAMNLAIMQLDKEYPLVVSDFHHYELDLPENAREVKIVKGDRKIFAVAAASIMAKVARDSYMKKLALADDNRYGWATNVGYRSRRHWEALRQHGLTEHHRKKYAQVWSPEQLEQYRKEKGNGSTRKDECSEKILG